MEIHIRHTGTFERDLDKESRLALPLAKPAVDGKVCGFVYLYADNDNPPFLCVPCVSRSPSPVTRV